jgi:hypothetical protein
MGMKSSLGQKLRKKQMSSNKYNPTWNNSKQNLPPSGKFVGWTAQVFKQIQERKDETKPESSIPPTLKSGQVEINGFEGCICVKCKEFYPYAEPNMDDGTLVCYGCRNPWPGN